MRECEDIPEKKIKPNEGIQDLWYQIIIFYWIILLHKTKFNPIAKKEKKYNHKLYLDVDYYAYQ